MMSPERVRRRAYDLVRDAIHRHGTLQPPQVYDCVDCGDPAECWDHRDYTKPLDVEPVCSICNTKRGQGYPLLSGPWVEFTFTLPRKKRKRVADCKYFRQEFRASAKELQALKDLAQNARKSKSAIIIGMIRKAAKRQGLWE